MVNNFRNLTLELALNFLGINKLQVFSRKDELINVNYYRLIFKNNRFKRYHTIVQKRFKKLKLMSVSVISADSHSKNSTI